MADIYGSYFRYAGVYSGSRGLIIASMQTPRMEQIAGTIGSVTFFEKYAQKNRLIDTDYTNFPLTFDVEILTTDANCVHVGEIPLTAAQQRTYEKWLFNNNEYRLFRLIDRQNNPDPATVEAIDEVDVNGDTVSSDKQLYLNCRFINPERIMNGGVVGWRATLEADSGLWWQDQIETRTFFVPPSQQAGTGADAVNTFTVHVDTDLNDYVYPRINIYFGDVGGTVTLVNNTDDSTRLTSWTALNVQDLPIGETGHPYVTIEGGVNYVTSADHFADQNFPRLLDGDNNFTIIGDVHHVRVRWQNRRNL